MSEANRLSIYHFSGRSNLLDSTCFHVWFQYINAPSGICTAPISWLNSCYDYGWWWMPSEKGSFSNTTFMRQFYTILWSIQKHKIPKSHLLANLYQIWVQMIFCSPDFNQYWTPISHIRFELGTMILGETQFKILINGAIIFI